MKSLSFITTLTSLMCWSVLVGCSPVPRVEISNQINSNSNIIGGTLINPSDLIANSTVAIFVTMVSDGNQGVQFVCTGSLIGNNIVLTAGHCAQGSDQKHQIHSYVVFANNLNNTACREVRTIVAQVVHPRFGQGGPRGEDQNDLALMKFAGTTPEGYRPISLFPADQKLAPGATLTLAGYGLNDAVKGSTDGMLRKVSVTLGDSFGRTEAVVDQSNGKGACHGDSGGPAIVSYRGTYALWGVTSRGMGHDDCLSMGVLTKVNTQVDFIQSALSQLGSNQSIR